MQPNLVSPPPWQLTGDGVVLLYHFPDEFNKQYSFMADYQQQAYKGWVGAVMMVDYKTSGVGPYRELIFIPGLFDLNGKLSFSISKIYVSTYDSVWNGIQNWGIPKELADFSVATYADGTKEFEVSKNDKTFFEASLKPFGIRLPITTKVLPLVRVIQQLRDQLLLTRLDARGQTQLSSLKSIYSDASFFPPVHQLKPLVSMSVHDFLMTFPVPTVL
ncbi:acetoacetate decarboxylase family protein [Pontibacter silvestris]|uniref:Acetoacetate decarboxylase family protein n=1 Tax=Pontibacter silvestris TaxID=2305183 RepID=A0ABW4X3I1_9BACT|nr:acetoacetate decarboxylase family protein [Pontibacter silvestris]MCC9134885.1 acetoacetate decarboxylase family protein [Pontibacter silvestris]